MIYVDTPRIAWRRSVTFPQFFGTTLLLGAAGAACVFGWTMASSESASAAAWAAMIIRTTLFGWEARHFWRSSEDSQNPGSPAPLLAWRFLKPVIAARIAFFVVSTFFGLLGIATSGRSALCFATIAFVSTFSSQMIERYCFFVTAAAPRMPGGVIQ